MSRLDFHFETDNRLSEDMDDLLAEAEVRLQNLAAEHSDMIGAAVALRELTGERTLHSFEARVVAYIRPENVVAMNESETPGLALERAVDAVIRQVRARREVLRKPYERKDKIVRFDEIEDLSSRELYAAYMDEADPAKVVNLSRDEVASRLMAEEGLDQPTAYFVADQVLETAQDILESEQGLS